MTEPKTLRVLARGSAMVPDLEAQENPYGAVRRFLGRFHDPEAGEMLTERVTGRQFKQGGFRANPGDVVTVPNRAEYRKHVVQRDLWPADVATAQACGVAFDATFGEEHPPEKVAKSISPVHSEAVTTKGN